MPCPWSGTYRTAQSAIENPFPNQHNWTTNERVEYLFPATRHTDGNLTVNWVSGRERPPKALTAAIPESIKYRFGCVLKGEAGLSSCGMATAPSCCLPRNLQM